MTAEPSSEQPGQRADSRVLESRYAQADDWPMPLLGLVTLGLADTFLPNDSADTKTTNQNIITSCH